MRCMKHRLYVTDCPSFMGEDPEEVCTECVAKITKEVKSDEHGSKPTDPRKGSSKSTKRQPEHALQISVRRVSLDKHRRPRLLSRIHVHRVAIKAQGPEELTLSPGPLLKDDSSNP